MNEKTVEAVMSLYVQYQWFNFIGYLVLGLALVMMVLFFVMLAVRCADSNLMDPFSRSRFINPSKATFRVMVASFLALVAGSVIYGFLKYQYEMAFKPMVLKTVLSSEEARHITGELKVMWDILKNVVEK